LEWACDDDDDARAANWEDEEVRGGMALGDWKKMLWFGVEVAEEEDGTAIAEGSFWDRLVRNMEAAGEGRRRASVERSPFFIGKHEIEGAAGLRWPWLVGEIPVGEGLVGSSSSSGAIDQVRAVECR